MPRAPQGTPGAATTSPEVSVSFDQQPSPSSLGYMSSSQELKRTLVKAHSSLFPEPRGAVCLCVSCSVMSNSL